MPTYVYECKSCNATFEVEQSIKDSALEDCTVCETGKVRRLIQPVGIAFKGSGFYVNDSKSVSASKPAEETKPAAMEAKTESPPAPAPAATTETPSAT
jgi:putative FmdB family regulatory protein